MNGNRFSTPVNANGAQKTQNVDVETFRHAVDTISNTLDYTLTDEFTITSQIAEGTNGLIGQIQVTHPIGTINFSVNASEEFVNDNHEQIGEKMSAEIVSRLLSEQNQRQPLAM